MLEYTLDEVGASETEVLDTGAGELAGDDVAELAWLVEGGTYMLEVELLMLLLGAIEEETGVDDSTTGNVVDGIAGVETTCDCDETGLEVSTISVTVVLVGRLIDELGAADDTNLLLLTGAGVDETTGAEVLGAMLLDSTDETGLDVEDVSGAGSDVVGVSG